MSTAVFLGVDGGGTKTAFALINQEGHVLARHEERGAYYLEIGMEACATLLEAGTRQVLAQAGLKADDLSFAFFGLPAYGEDSRLQPVLDALPSGVLPTNRYRCGNDMICSWSGSLAGQDGISVIAGTGSIAYGEYAQRSARAGGWGELFSDEGSAYWIAREGLCLFSRMSDGRCERGPLYTLFRTHFGLTNDLDMCAAIYGPTGLQRSGLAQLAKLVCKAAEAGDAEAQAIFAAAARELVQLIEATRRALQVPQEAALPVSYTGGVFSSEALVLEPFREALRRSPRAFALTPPRFEPVIGAALYAAKSINCAIRPESICP